VDIQQGKTNSVIDPEDFLYISICKQL
jgi:hypothetical protein